MAKLAAHMFALSLMFNPSCSAMIGSWLYRPSSDKFLQGKTCALGAGQERQQLRPQPAQHRQPTGAEVIHKLQLHAAQCRQLKRDRRCSSVIAGDIAVCLGCNGSTTASDRGTHRKISVSAYHPLKGQAVKVIPPTLNSMLDTTGMPYHLRPRFASQACFGCRMGTSAGQ